MAMNEHVELVKAVGIPVAELSMMEIYLAAGGIIHSQTLRKYVVPKYLNGSVLPPTARLHALKHDVTPEDLATIRAEAYKAIPGKLKGHE